MLVKGKKSTPNQTSSVWLVVRFSGMRWHLLPTFNSISAVKTAAGRMPSQLQRQLNQPKGIATFTLMCQKASGFFLHLAMSVCHLQTKPQLLQKFFVNDPRASNEVSSHRRMRSLEIIMAGRPPWTWVLSNTKDPAEQWETFFLAVCHIQRIVIWQYLAYFSSKHTFVPALFEYMHVCVTCFCVVHAIFGPVEESSLPISNWTATTVSRCFFWWWQPGSYPESEGWTYKIMTGKMELLYMGSTISTLLHEKINPKDWQVSSLGDAGFLQFFGVVSIHYGKPRYSTTPD